MRWAFILLVIAHGLLHFMGPAKAFGLAELPQLHPVTRAMGALWLVAGALLIAGGGLVAASSPWWWAPAAAGVVASQIAIFAAWDDAR